MAEDLQVARDIMLAELTGARVHVAHISTARSVAFVREAKTRGVQITCEVTPHHFTLTDAEVQKRSYHTHTKMAPPLRSEKDVAAMLEGLSDGTIDAIATDHAPHHANEKMLEFDRAPFGIVGLETAVPLALDRLVATGIISMTRLIDLLSCIPARIFNLPGGSLLKGSPADITIFDPDREIVIDAASFKSKSRNTPFDAWKLKGMVMATFVAGRRPEAPAGIPAQTPESRGGIDQ
jgi:dihydroorotase